MKIALIVLIAASVATSAPVDESSTKEKRGLSLGLGYHTPLLTHSHVLAPTLIHSAPLYHAPIITHHSPIITSHSISHSLYPSYHLPAISTLHHYK